MDARQLVVLVPIFFKKVVEIYVETVQANRRQMAESTILAVGKDQLLGALLRKMVLFQPLSESVQVKAVS